MIFLRVLPKIFLWHHYSGAPGVQELGGLGSLNRLNPVPIRHCRDVIDVNHGGWACENVALQLGH